MEKIVLFLLNRIYLIDIIKEPKKIIFMLEESFNNYYTTIEQHSISCSCDNFNNKLYVCKHIKFILELIDKFNDKRSKSCNEIVNYDKIFFIDIKHIDTFRFKNDRNPRYSEYKILQDSDYSGNCYICLDKLSKKIMRCKNCNRYYHEQCIYGWLRLGVKCTCPVCRNLWI